MTNSITTNEPTRNPDQWSIETVYKGTRFRSRLEARWAVFFDTLGIRWEFEPETFVTPYGRYAPDFLLPELKQFVEVKPRSLTTHEHDRAAWIVQHTGMRLSVLGKFPEHAVSAYDTADAAAVECVRGFRAGVGGFPTWSAIIEGGAGDFPFMWCRCQYCGRVEWQFDGRAGRMSCRGKSCPPNPHDAKDYSHDDPAINNAYDLARRFRFWETPR